MGRGLPHIFLQRQPEFDLVTWPALCVLNSSGSVDSTGVTIPASMI